MQALSERERLMWRCGPSGPERFRLAGGAGHPEARLGEASDAGEDAAGAERKLAGEALQLCPEVGAGRQADGVRAHRPYSFAPWISASSAFSLRTGWASRKP